MSDLPELHRAYSRPSESDTEQAWQRVQPRLTRAGRPRMRLLMAAAVVASLIAAFGVGYATGRRAVPSGTGSPDQPIASPSGVVIRAPELVAEPGR